ncbi:MAG: hypothetical protein ACI90V_010637 [Bacillariaceae sp.]|jgi:hypothetical protein
MSASINTASHQKSTNHPNESTQLATSSASTDHIETAIIHFNDRDRRQAK